jgi:broad specificity phosphatase PhoE
MRTRLFSFLAAAVALTAAPSVALAQSAAIQSITIGDELADKREDYGRRDIEELTAALRSDIGRAFSRAGLLDGDGAGIRIDVVLNHAWPNRPTRQQMRAQPGLSYLSISRGGADLSAVIQDSEGREISRIDYDWRTPFLEDSAHRSTWSDAERTFERFAHRLTQAVRDAEAGA